MSEWVSCGCFGCVGTAVLVISVLVALIRKAAAPLKKFFEE